MCGIVAYVGSKECAPPMTGASNSVLLNIATVVLLVAMMLAGGGF